MVAPSSICVRLVLESLVLQPDRIAFEPRQAAALDRLDRDVARHIEARARRAVEEARIDADARRLPCLEHLLAGREGHFEPLGNVIFHKEARLPDGIRFRVGIGLDAPGAVLGVRKQRQREGTSAEALVIELDTLVFDTVRAPE